MSKWTEATTVKFVQEYLRCECLWNVKSKHYRNKQEKQQAILEIVATMAIDNFGAKEAEAKIKSIRSTYSQELKKIKEATRSGSGTEEIYKPNIKWFDLLHGSLNSVDIAEARTTQDNTETTNRVAVATESDQDQQFPVPVSAPRKRKLRDLNLLVDKVANVQKAMSTAETSVTENEFDMFAKSVGCQLKAMSLIQALQAQQHIQNYLCQLRLKELMTKRIPSPTGDLPLSPSSNIDINYTSCPSQSPSWISEHQNPNDSNVPLISLSPGPNSPSTSQYAVYITPDNPNAENTDNILAQAVASIGYPYDNIQ